MVKLNLSAMQNNAADTANITENNDSIKQLKSLETKSKIFNATPIQKKKMSLNSLISGTNEEEILDSKENLLNINIVSTETIVSKNQEEEIKKVPNKTKITLGLLNTERNNIKSSEEESQTLNQEIKVLDIKKEEKFETLDETKIEEKKKEMKSISISDGDTIGNLITDINKTEMFVWYVSSFEKEMEALKKKNTKIQAKVEKEKKSVIVPEILSTEKEEIDLDKIIENVKTKEENTIIKTDLLASIDNPLLEEKINTPLENFNKSVENTTKIKKNFKIPAMIFSVFVLVASWFFYYLNLGKTVKDNSLKVNVLETNTSAVNQSNDDKENLEHIKTIEQNINNTTNNQEVKEKLIKYFKNKQNNVKIEVNKN